MMSEVDGVLHTASRRSLQCDTMCHPAMLEGTESGSGSTWLDPVTNEQYAAANEA
jgi:hypothetical protein